MMGQFQLFPLMLVSACALLQATSVVKTRVSPSFPLESDCNPLKHRVLNQTYRSTGFDTRSTDTAKCDNRLKRGWYRFIDVNGDAAQMPTSCPGINKCGTTTPIWMDGVHPTLEEKIVERRVCGKLKEDPDNANCCGFKDDIFVANCSRFYIYYLNPVFDCPMSFCAGTVSRCPVGQWSSNNFEPCREPAPVLVTLPVVSGPVVRRDQTFELECKIVYDAKDTDHVFAVIWKFNGKTDPSLKSTLLTGSERVATLNGNNLKNRLDANVGCDVVTYYLGREKEKKTYTSKAISLDVQEVKLTGPNLRGKKEYNFVCEITFPSNDLDQQIEVAWTFDGQKDSKIKPQIITGKQRQVTLDGRDLRNHLNTNVQCQARLVYKGFGLKSNYRRSKAYFAGLKVNPDKVLEISESDGEKVVTIISTVPIVCDKPRDCCLSFKLNIDKKAVVTLKDSCDYKICSKDWDNKKKQASLDITVVPSRNTIAGATRETVLSFEKLVISGTGKYIPIFSGHKPSPLKIAVKLEAGFSCSMAGDPHIEGVEKGIFDLYSTGDFIVYVVKDRDFMIQIRTWPCWSATCVCGVIVKEKNNIIRVHGCDKPKRLKSSIVDIPYKLSPGNLVLRSDNGQHIGILLESGSEIKIDITDIYMNVHIQTPAYDRGKIVGICGTNDGNPANDFTHSNGTITPLCSGRGRCIPVSFTDSWRVNGNDSMFVRAPLKPKEKPSTQYCACPANSTGTSCSSRKHIQSNKLACNGCEDITESLRPSPWGQPGNEQPPYVPPPTKPVDPNQQWPSADGTTESQAREICLNALKKSQIYIRCKDIDNLVEAAMSDCLGDILNGGTTDAVDASVESFTTNCQATLAQDEKNCILGPDGDCKLDPGINDLVCPIECFTNGKCGPDGICQCKTGWEGQTCQIETVKGPQILRITSGPWCDAKRGNLCRRVEFDKSNVNIHERLECRIQPIDEHGKPTEKDLLLGDISDSPTRVACPLPMSKVSHRRYTISVRTETSPYGNELPVYVYDSTCQDCGETGCTQKSTACHINNICYENGKKNKKNKAQVCDVNKSRTSWSPRASGK